MRAVTAEIDEVVEAEWNKWCGGVHLPEASAAGRFDTLYDVPDFTILIDGYQSGQRNIRASLDSASRNRCWTRRIRMRFDAEFRRENSQVRPLSGGGLRARRYA